MDIEERATAKVYEADLEALIEAEINRRGYNIIGGLTGSALVGLKLELELIRVNPGNGSGKGVGKKREVATPNGRPL